MAASLCEMLKDRRGSVGKLDIGRRTLNISRQARETRMVHLSRSAALTGYVDVAYGAGLDPFPLLAACGIPPDALADPDIPISADAFARLLERSARASGLDDFG